MEGTMFDRILITGASGLLGSNLSRQFASGADVTGLYHSHPVRIDGVRLLPCDLTDYAAIRAVVAETNPDLVVHCASRTDVDRMEGDPEGAWKANVLTTRNLVDALRDVPARLVYISSDSVYPGDCGPSREDAACAPRNVYGRTKLEGERVALAREGTLVLRTNLFGWNVQDKKSIAEWFLANLESGTTCVGFRDAVFNGIYTRLLGDLILKCLERGLSGVFNCASRDAMSKYRFGCELARAFGYDPSLIESGSIEGAHLGAPRGHDMTMDMSALERALGERLPTMEESLVCFVEDWRESPCHFLSHKQDFDSTTSGGVWLLEVGKVGGIPGISIRKSEIAIQCAGVMLRTLYPEDVTSRYVQWMNDPLVTRFVESRYQQHSLQSLKEYVQSQLESRSTLLLGIFDMKGLHIGNIKLGPINPLHSLADIGVIVGDKGCWGKGIASDAILHLVRWAFSVAGLHKLTAGAYASNVASIRAFQKCGFLFEGLGVDHHWCEGKFVDSYRLGLVNPAAGLNERSNG